MFSHCLTHSKLPVHDRCTDHSTPCAPVLDCTNLSSTTVFLKKPDPSYGNGRNPERQWGRMQVEWKRNLFSIQIRPNDETQMSWPTRTHAILPCWRFSIFKLLRILYSTLRLFGYFSYVSLFLPSMISRSLEVPDVPSNIKEKPWYFCNYNNKTSSFA